MYLEHFECVQNKAYIWLIEGQGQASFCEALWEWGPWAFESDQILKLRLLALGSWAS